MLSALRYTVRVRTMAADPMKKDEHDPIQANLAKMMAETMKIAAETSKINKDGRVYAMITFGIIAVASVASFATIIIVILRRS